MIKIITDATNDLSAEYLKENNIELMPMGYTIDGETFVDDKTVDLAEFYNKIREGKLPTTSMIIPLIYEETFEKFLKDGDEVLYIAFSSGLTGSFNSCLLAKNSLDNKYPNKIYCFDTRSASMGMGILVKIAVKMIKEGKTAEEIVSALTEIRERVVILLGVDNLFHLERGGRISKAAAILGSTLNLKPIIKVTNEGKLSSFKKVMGRKKLLQTFIEYYSKYRDDSQKDNVYVLHADCVEDANMLKTKLDTTYNMDSQVVGIGTIIGTHVGANAIAIAFIANTTKDEIK